MRVLLVKMSTLRTIHHFSCSGGTVISKVIQSMKNVQLVSEIHPHNLKYRFNPFDPTQLLLSRNSKQNIELCNHIFLNRIKECKFITDKLNQKLVLRDHTHFDYLIASNAQSIINTKSLIDVLSNDFKLISLLTIRNPIDIYLSLERNKWYNHSLSNKFDDFCRRFNLMINTYSQLGIKIIKYEDFCEKPYEVTKEICEVLNLQFNKFFMEIFFKVELTGDSGRGNEMTTIEPLPPRFISKDFKKEILSSVDFDIISKKFNYKIHKVK